jgi:hypothetical protein
MRQQLFEQARSLPDVISARYPIRRDHREVVGLKIEIPKRKTGWRPRFWTEKGEISSADFFEWCLGRNVYFCETENGVLDSVFRGYKSEVLRELVRFRTCRIGDYEVRLSGSGNTYGIIVRKGNLWGRVINLRDLGLDLRTPKHCRLAGEMINLKLRKYNIGNFVSCGMTGQQIFISGTHARHILCDSIPKIVTYRALQSFKPGRMEGIIFGRSYVYDYDIVGAYPNEIGELASLGMNTKVGVLNEAKWVDSEKIVVDADYAAVRGDVWIDPRLERGPIPIRFGKDSYYYPVGNIFGVWLTKPDIDLLLEYPSVGRILKIHEGSWVISRGLTAPFRSIIKSLHHMRITDPIMHAFMKRTMVVPWGKFIGTYICFDGWEPDEYHTQASCLYNPLLAAHVCAKVRTNLYRRGLTSRVVGEFIDGLTLLDSYRYPETFGIPPLGNQLGDFVEVGKGELVLFNDQYKGSSWKNREILDFAFSQRDQLSISYPITTRQTLSGAYAYYGPRRFANFIGEEITYMQRIPLGPSSRLLPKYTTLRVGDLLEDTVKSVAIQVPDIPKLHFMTRIERITDRLSRSEYEE